MLMVICEKLILVLMELKVKDLVRVMEDEGEQIIDYYAVIIPCCIEVWGIGKLTQNIKKNHFSEFIPVMERFAYCSDSQKIGYSLFNAMALNDI